MNKFPLSKQHGLVLMLQRAMEEEEEKKSKCKKGGEGLDRFKNLIHQRRQKKKHAELNSDHIRVGNDR